MKLIDNGYLPNYPYHLISDEEMVNAFLGRKLVSAEDEPIAYDLTGFFIDNYPAVPNPTSLVTTVSQSYDNLILSIYCILQLYLLYKAKNIIYEIPDWVYSYMLGAVISVNSDKKDIHDVIKPLGVDNIDDDFDFDCEAACNAESLKWLRQSNQVATMPIPYEFEHDDETGRVSFIEDYLANTYFLDGTSTRRTLEYVYSTSYTDLVGIKPDNSFYLRPPTIFGEPHVIKSIRLS